MKSTVVKTKVKGRKWNIKDTSQNNFVEDKTLVNDIVEKYKDNFPKVYGVPRSGSTLLRNILNTIFDGNIKVQKHDYFKTDTKVICSYRDFRDSTISQWRIQKAGFDKEENAKVATFGKIEENARRIKSQVGTLKHFKERYPSNQIYFARYEDYHDNFDILCDDLEKFLDITIKDQLRKFLQRTWNKKRIKKVYSDNLEAFQGYDEQTEIHGQHIYKGKVGTWKELLQKDNHKMLNEFFQKELLEWGYKI